MKDFGIKKCQGFKGELGLNKKWEKKTNIIN